LRARSAATAVGLWLLAVTLAWPNAAVQAQTVLPTADSPAVVATPAGALRVQVPSLDLDAAGQPVQQPAFWWPPVPARGHAASAIVLLHGCGGPYGQGGSALSRRMVDYAAWLRGQGLAVLVTDSLSPRGERELCTQRLGTRRVTQQHRLRDALGALQWLAAQPGIDAGRLGLLGWSNGGSTVLAASNLRQPEVAAATVRPAFAAAFYPGCVDALAQGYQPAMPLLMLLGAADDWTPPAPCQRLAEVARPSAGVPAPQAVAYDGAFHGFDGMAPVRLRRDVPNGTHPGQGVHVGGDAAAREAALARLQQFLAEQLAPRR
jgi:dienelactone hydrolase